MSLQVPLLWSAGTIAATSLSTCGIGRAGTSSCRMCARTAIASALCFGPDCAGATNAAKNPSSRNMVPRHQALPRYTGSRSWQAEAPRPSPLQIQPAPARGRWVRMPDLRYFAGMSDEGEPESRSRLSNGVGRRRNKTNGLDPP